MDSDKKFRPDMPLTIGYIRDQIRRNQYVGDTFEALRYLLKEYDTVNSKLKMYTKPIEYSVSGPEYKGDVVG